MVVKKKIKKLLNKIQIIDDSKDKLEKFNYIYNQDSVKILTFLNHYAMNIAYEDPQFYNILIESELMYRDGVGIEIACLFNKIQPGLNMVGTDFLPMLLEEHKNKKIAIFGSNNDVINKFYELYSSKYNIVSHIDGYKDNNLYIDELNLVKPDILLLAMGMPKQEYLSKYIKDMYMNKLTVINGGAILDFMTGKIKRAPKFVIKCRLEWLVRLYKEPRRLFLRYVIGIPLFLYRVFKELILDE
jgi:exopolysaccharide biosynthesis WecB/TagA/CpsF family protein